jgi:hypothetical protein
LYKIVHYYDYFNDPAQENSFDFIFSRLGLYPYLFPNNLPREEKLVYIAGGLKSSDLVKYTYPPICRALKNNGVLVVVRFEGEPRLSELEKKEFGLELLREEPIPNKMYISVYRKTVAGLAPKAGQAEAKKMENGGVDFNAANFNIEDRQITRPGSDAASEPVIQAQAVNINIKDFAGFGFTLGDAQPCDMVKEFSLSLV